MQIYILCCFRNLFSTTSCNTSLLFATLLHHQLQQIFCTMIRRKRTTNRWRQQAPLVFFYWNLYVERQRRIEQRNLLSEQKDWLEQKACGQISPPPPSIIYITTTTAMASQPQQSSSGQKAGTHLTMG